MENCLEIPEAIKFSLPKKIKTQIIINLMKIDENDVTLDIGSGGGYFRTFWLLKLDKLLYLYKEHQIMIKASK